MAATEGLAGPPRLLRGDIGGCLGTAALASAAAKSALRVAGEDEERILGKISEAELSNSALKNTGLSRLTVSQKNNISCRKQ